MHGKTASINFSWSIRMAKDELIYSGLSAEQFEAKGDSIPSCFMCKRSHDDDSVVIKNGEAEVYELDLKEVFMENGENMFKFFVCDECLVFLHGFLNPRETKLKIC